MESVAKLRCSFCHTLVEVFESPGGARTVSVLILGPSVEATAKALEAFSPPDRRPELPCPACGNFIDPLRPYQLPRLSP